MSEAKLDLILQELQKLSNEQQKLSSGQQKLSSEQQKMNGRLDSHGHLITQLIGKVSEVHLDLREVKENTQRLEIKLDDHIVDTRGDIRFLNHRIADAELELEKLKNR